MKLSAELAGKYGESVETWTARLCAQGITANRPMTLLSARERRQVKAMVRAHRDATHTPESAPALTLDYITWSRRTLGRYITRSEPWRIEGAAAQLLEEARRTTTLKPSSDAGLQADALDIQSVPTLSSGGLDAQSAPLIAFLSAFEHDYTLRRVLWTLAPYSRGIAPPRRLLGAIFQASGLPRVLDMKGSTEFLSFRRAGIDYLRLAERAQRAPADTPAATDATPELRGILERVDIDDEDSPQLIFSSDVNEGLEHLEIRWRHRNSVHGEADAHAQGLIACLAGPEGQGKRSAIRSLARRLELPLYRIHAGRLASRYIGETEARISAVFKALPKEAVLSVADAQDLLSSRVEVRRSNDRYSNMSVNHLLTCLEDWPGLTVLTVESATGLDRAIQRRIALTLRVDPPDKARWEAIAEAQWLWLSQRLSPALRGSLDAVDTWCHAGFRLSPARLRATLIDAALHAEADLCPLSPEALRTRLASELTTMGFVVKHDADS